LNGGSRADQGQLAGGGDNRPFFVSAILVFVFRLLGKPQWGHWLGYFEFLLAIPLVYLLVRAMQLQRPWLNYVQIGCMLA
jgi:hypothetical protein